MTPVLVLAGTVVAWATADALRKRLAGDVEPVPLAVVLAAGTLPLFALWALYEGPVWPELAYWPWTGAAAVGNIAGAVLLLGALRVAPISVVIPLLSLSPVFSALLGLLLLSEVPTPRQWGGMGLIVGGAGVLAVTGEGRANVPGVLMGTGVALSFAATVVLDKGALQYVPTSQHGFMTGLLLSGGLLLWLTLRGRLHTFREVRRHAPWVAAASLTLAAALALQLLAVQLWLVSVVEGTKRALGISAAALVGRLFFDEPLTVTKLVAIGVLVAGVVLLV